MNWQQLLSPRRYGEYKTSYKKKSNDLRSEFEKDFHRIIGSASFRRLQDKTQVFPLDKSDFIRTRLTHSLEVSSLAKSLGQNAAALIRERGLDPSFTWQMKEDICNILQCAGLIHDIGNPPFGHFGEDAIRSWFRENLPGLRFRGRPVTEVLQPQMLQDLYHYEGNAQALRLVSKLHFLVNENGMNLTYALLHTIIKYPVDSLGIDKDCDRISCKKMGYFAAEQSLYEQIAEACGTKGARHPLTFLLEAADDIAYVTADIEDAFKKGLLSYDTLRRELARYLDRAYPPGENYPVQVLEYQYKKALDRKDAEPQLYAVSNFCVRIQGYLLYCASEGFAAHYREIMEGRLEQDILTGTPGKAIAASLSRIAYDHAFVSMPIMKLEVAAGQMLNYFLDSFVKAFLYYDTEVPMGIMEQKFAALISDNYKQIYHYHAEGRSEEERLYLRLLLVCDHISGMTDSFARDLYQELHGLRA